MAPNSAVICATCTRACRTVEGRRVAYPASHVSHHSLTVVRAVLRRAEVVPGGHLGDRMAGAGARSGVLGSPPRVEPVIPAAAADALAYRQVRRGVRHDGPYHPRRSAA